MYDATGDLVHKWKRARVKGNIDCFLGKEDLSSIATVLHGHLNPFATISGVCQGCVADLNLFNVAVDFWTNRAVEQCPNLGTDKHFKFQDLDADNVALNRCLQLAHSIFGQLTKVWSSDKIRITNEHPSSPTIWI